MKKKFYSASYLILALFLATQLVSTVLALSQNVGYGQRIAFLENKKTQLQAEQTQLQQQLAQQLAINALSSELTDYQQIGQVLLVSGPSANLALR